MDLKQRYLNNPHFKVDAKIRRQLNITDDDISGVAVRTTTPKIRTKKQVVRSHRADNQTDENLLQK